MPGVWNLIGFTSLIIVVFCIVVVYHSSRSYEDTLKNGKEDALRISHSMADHVELTFLGADLSLRRAIEGQNFNALFGGNLIEYTEQNFKLWLKETPQLAAMAMLDDKGRLLASAAKDEFSGWLDGNRSQNFGLEALREADDRHVLVARYAASGQPPMILLSRRYNRLDGEFGGIVVAALSASYFLDFYQSIASGSHPYMNLALQDGTLLAFGPFKLEKGGALSKRLGEARREAGGEARAEVINDAGELFVVAQRTLRNLPVEVNIIQSGEDLLADWRQMRAKDIGFLVLFIVFGSVLSFFTLAMARHIMRAEESENAAILASQAKSEFLANMSHELRTPLNAIIGFSEMINSGYFGPLTTKQRERIHDINLCGTHLLQLINDILEFSKGDAGKLELIEEKVDVHEIIHECARIMSGKIKAKNILLTIDITPGLASLWGDKRKIRQILLNLLSNSLKFTAEGGSIRMSAKADTNGAIQIGVADTGIGIPEDEIQKALSVFGQVHRSQSHEGTGLGLPLCKMYAELHGGRLILTSKVGEGTSVRILFPHQRTLSPRAG